MPRAAHPLIPLLLLVGACGESRTTEPPLPPPPPPPSLVLASVDPLIPGTEVRVHGSGLLGLDSLRIDGVLVSSITRQSDETARFTVPHFRDCESDGRPVVLAAGGATITGHIELPHAASLAVGESRLLSSDDLQCLQLPARDEDHVLSVANTELPTGTKEAVRTLLRLRTLPSHPHPPAAAAPAAVTHGGRPTPVPSTATHRRAAMDVRSASGAAPMRTASPSPFDPRYATAQAGDTVTMVAWSWNGPEALRICGLPRAEVPTFPALVLGVAGDVVAAVDLRVAPAPAVLAAARSGWLQQSLELVAPVLLPTMRSIFDPSFQPLAGGNGRYWVLFTSQPSGHALDGHLPGATGGFQRDCAHASEMTVMTAPVSMLADAWRDVGLVSKFFIHEYAHSAEMITAAGLGLHYSALWGEPWAVLAEETAARISLQQPQDARMSMLGFTHPWAGNSVDVMFWGRDPHRGPWQEDGRYSTGANMLLFLRELAGEVAPQHGRNPTMYRRLMSHPGGSLDPSANIARVAAVHGIDYVELTDRWMLAAVTAGLVPPHTADALGLPRFRSWDVTFEAREYGPLSPGFPSLRRNAAEERTLSAAPGAHAALYLFGSAHRGTSVRLVQDGGGQRIIRLTRIR